MCGIPTSSPNTSCQCPPFSQALMPELELLLNARGCSGTRSAMVQRRRKKYGHYLFRTACPGWASAIAGRRTELEPILMFRAHAWVGSCCCKRPDAALKAGRKRRRLQLHWEWAKKASHHTPRRKTSSYRTIPASRDAADCPACQAPANVAAVMAHRIV